MPAEKPNRLLTVLKLVLLATSAFLVVRIVIAADLGRVMQLIASSGPLILFGFLPYLAAITIDTSGWRILLGALGRRPPLAPLLSLRLSTEAVLLSFPMGPAVAESLKAYLLEKRMGVPIPEGVSSQAVQKVLMPGVLGVFMLTSALVGWPYLSAASQTLIGRGGLPLLVLACAGGLGVAAFLAWSSVRYGGLSGRLHRVLMALPIPRMRAWLEQRRRRFTDVDAHFAPIAAAPGRVAAAGVTFLFGLFVEMLESFLLLKLVGADITLTQLLAVEASVLFIRSMAVFVPAGLGFQDAGYLAFFGAFGIPDATQVGTAFVLLKRTKELVWVIVGYLLLAATRERPSEIIAAAASTSTPPVATDAPRLPRVILICGSINQTKQMHQIALALGPGYDCWFTPYSIDGALLTVMRWLRLIEVSIGGYKMRRRSLEYLRAHELPVDVDGRRGGYDLVITCSDIVTPSWIRGLPMVAVQEGMTDPENWLFRLWQRFPRIVPRWAGGTATTGMSYEYDKFCVASEGYKRFFVEKKGAPPDRLEVTGMPNFDDCERYKQNDFPHHGFALVCTSDMRETYKLEDRGAFLANCVKIAAGRQLIFKLHPNEKLERATREILAVAPDALIYTSGSAEEMIANCDVLISQYSSVAYVGLALGKETHSYFDVDELRRLMPVQNRSAARRIAEVCQRVLEGSRVPHTVPSRAPAFEPIADVAVD